MRAGTGMLVTDVFLQYHGVCEHFWAVLTRIPLVFSVYCFVLNEIGSPGKCSWTVVTAVLTSSIPMSSHQVVVQSGGDSKKNNVKKKVYE